MTSRFYDLIVEGESYTVTCVRDTMGLYLDLNNGSKRVATVLIHRGGILPMRTTKSINTHQTGIVKRALSLLKDMYSEYQLVEDEDVIEALHED